jgi:iron complex outermembrane receptor protein
VFDPNYPGAPRGFIAGGTGNFVQINSVGFRPGSFYVYKQVYDKNNNPIENLFEDRNRDGVINEKDRYRYMSPEPDVLLGVNSSLSYKKWTAGFVLRGSFGNYMYNNFNSVRGTYFGILDPNGFLANASRKVLTTNFTTNSVEQLLSDYHVENASFLRMDNINIGYNVGKIAKGINMRASLNVQNAFIITKYSGIDPEIAGGIDNNLYPRPRMFVLGVNLDF